MRPVRRMFVTIAAPMILLAGLAVVLGVRKGSAMIHQLEAWSDSLEHSPGPVELRIAGVPILSNMYVDGDKVGKFDRIVVMRDRPGGLDSLQIVVSVPNSGHLARLSECKLQVDPDVLEDNPFDGWTRVMHCVSEPEGLVSFGSVVFDGTDRTTPLLVDPALLPCEAGGSSGNCVDTSELRREMLQLREELRREFKHNTRRVRIRRN